MTPLATGLPGGDRDGAPSLSAHGAATFRFRPPAWVWVAALGAFLVHMLPYWWAASQTPAGWVFTGNMNSSPDYMQYRVWMRQSQEEGLLVSNRFTAEANPPHLPMVLYWSIGGLARLTGLSPEWTYAWLGALLAAAGVLVLYALVRHFLAGAAATAWVFWILIVGGGLGGVLVWLQDSGIAGRHILLERAVLVPLQGPGHAAPFERYRGNYVLQAIMDGHFMVMWLLALLAVLMLYATVRRFSAGRLAVTAASFAAATFVHVYEGLLLMAITAGVCLLCWRKGWAGRHALATLATCATAVGVVLLPLAARFGATDLPLPSWRGVIVAPVILLLAYPLAWALWATGLGRFWREAGLPGAFLLGWAVGCLAITLSGPFYPYPDRGILTLQVPLLISAGMIYFSRRSRVGVLGALLVVLLHASTPLLLFGNLPARTRFDPEATHKWISTDHVAMIDALEDASTSADLLVADEVTLRWLAPEYPGRHAVGHFFLTAGYERKRERLLAFYTTDGASQRQDWLAELGATLLFVAPWHDPAAFDGVVGLSPVLSNSAGTLYRYSAPGGTR